MKSMMRNCNRWFGIRNEAEAVAAASFSACMTAIVLWCMKASLYGKIPLYDQLVTGGCTYLGYNKQGDLNLFYAVLILIPVFYLLCILMIHLIYDNKYYVNDMCADVHATKHTDSPADHSSDNDCLSDNKQNKKTNFFVATLADYLDRFHNYGFEVLADMVVIFFACMALECFASSVRPMYQDFFVKGRMVVAAVMLLGYLYIRKSGKSFKVITNTAHMALAFCFLGFYKFYYAYEGQAGLMQLFYSAKWKAFCLVCFVGFFGWQLFYVWRYKKPSMLSSTILVGVMSVAKLPEGVLSVDFFHNGEMSFPMQQLASFGKIPYFDMDPIHGFCDYVYSFCNYVFFDGTYFSQNAGIFVASILMAAFLSLVVGVCLVNKERALCFVVLFMPFMVEQAGVRYVLFFAAFFVLLSEYVRKDVFSFIFWYGIFCMAGIAYNVSIGSSMAVAFFPVALYMCFANMIPKIKDFKHWDRDLKIKRIAAYALLVVLVVCYMPLFLQIIRFLKENAGTTTYVNGTPIFGEEFSVFETFALVFPYVCLIGNMLKGLHNNDSVERKVGPTGKLFVVSFSCLFVIINYACVRYDEAQRLVVLAIFFSLLYVCFSKRRNRLIVLIMAMYLCRNHLVDLASSMMQVQAVPVQMEVELVKDEPVMDAVVYVSGESVGMPNLGVGFIQGTTLTSLQNVQAVLQNEDAYDSYLDLTNRVSHYVILDAECHIPFTSAYNISNDLMQYKAIEWIKNNQPKLILLSPYIQFDQATTSLRSILFFDQIMDMGYNAYTYGDVTYLLRGESNFLEATDGRRMLGLLCHRTSLGALPYEWAGAIENYDYEAKKFTKTEFLSKNALVDVKYIMLTIDKGEILSSDTFPESMTFSFMSRVDGEVHSFEFDTGWDANRSVQDNIEALADANGKLSYLIPVCSSPFFIHGQGYDIRIDGFDMEKIEYTKYVK